MRNLVSALVVAVFMAATVPAEAQESVSATTWGVANSNTQRAIEGVARVVALAQVVSDPAWSRSLTREEYIAAFDAKASAVAAARAEIQGIHRELIALPPVYRPGDALSLQAADQTVMNAATFALQADQLLEGFQGLGSALRAGDTPRIQRALGALTEGVVLIVDSQVLSIRSALFRYEPDSTELALYSAEACFFEGVGYFYRGVFNMMPKLQASNRMANSAQCIADNVVAGRAALERETSGPTVDVALEGVRAQLRPIISQTLTEVSAGADLLRTAGVDLADGPEGERIIQRHQAGFAGVERRIMEQQSREDAVMGSL